jgi:tRNA-splicing ligase RtcB
MDPGKLEQLADDEWRINPVGAMRVPGIIYADADLIGGMDDKVYEQIVNVATLPGIVKASYGMPDAHWGYGFPIGGVAAFDPAQGGVVSAGGVGFDISCGVRSLTTGLTRSDIEAHKGSLADALFTAIPAGLGSTGTIRLDKREMQAMLTGGARWAVSQGYGYQDDLQYIEENGCMSGALAEEVSQQAKRRQRDEMGTLGSGNHYLEIQQVIGIYDADAAQAFALHENDIVVSIHCGSRGLGHQIGTEFLKRMAMSAHQYDIELPDRELACAPINSPLGEAYLGAMRAGINCALANRQILTHLARRAFERVLPRAELQVLYDVSHNTCKQEEHLVDGKAMQLFVHRKGATRALGPGHPDLPGTFRKTGQPVLIGGSMGTASYILAGLPQSEQRSFASACHGAGRAMSRRKASRQWQGRQVIDELSARGILIRSHSYRGVAEEAPGAYKNVDAVVDAAEKAGLARKVAKLAPVICVKG